MSKKTAALTFFVFLLLHAQAGFCRGGEEDVAAGLSAEDAVLLVSPAGEVLFSHNTGRRLVPASSLKVLTALAAIHHLGAEHRFATEFYGNRKNDLIIKGYGDPMLVSEEVDAICGILKERLDTIRHIIIDNSYFAQKIRIPGVSENTLQPYNAPNGALCVNFNTVYFRIRNKRIESAESQTPLTPIAIKRIRETKVSSGRILLSDRADESLIYAGQLFAHFLREKGIAVRGSIRKGPADPFADRLIYRHFSRWELSRVIANLLRYSNNYMANQILLALGASVSGPPATLEKGACAVRVYAEEKIGIEGLRMVEGSGISRENRISADMFRKILDAFRPFYALLPQNGSVYAKTGTLDGIRTRVGYIAADEGLYRFVVMLNSAGKDTGPIVRKLVNRILEDSGAEIMSP
jgi:D-alanyl-D-alanine carboxypeptidase/D-alanyl-D-alanine-endopeptidase (penicillin-binding protein 4)